MSKGSFKLLLCRHSVAKTELKIELANIVLNGCNLVVATSTVLNLTKKWKLRQTDIITMSS